MTTDPAVPGRNVIHGTTAPLATFDEGTSVWSPKTLAFQFADPAYVHVTVEAVAFSTVPAGLSLTIQWLMPAGFTFPDFRLFVRDPQLGDNPLNPTYSAQPNAFFSDYFESWPHSEKDVWFVDHFPITIDPAKTAGFLAALAAGTVEVGFMQINNGADVDPYITVSALSLSYPGRPPLRQFPRDDGLATSSVTRSARAASRQASIRRGPAGTYL